MSDAPLNLSDGESFSLIAMGDIHVYRPTRAPWRLFNKRIAAQVNAWRNPGRRFDDTLLEPTLARVVELAPQLLVLTGDLTVSALDEEFAVVADALQPVRRPEGPLRTIGLPGNHDRYTFGSQRARVMERNLPGLLPDAFPHMIKLTDRWRLLALDSARPTTFHSRGRLGAEQLAVAGQYVGQLSADDGLVVACHYPWGAPPGEAMKWGHLLADADGLRNLLRVCPCPVLFMHGHVHRPWLFRGEGDLSHVIDLNVGTPTRRSEQFGFGQGFWEVGLPGYPGRVGAMPGGESEEIVGSAKPQAAAGRGGLVHHYRSGEDVWVSEAVDWPA